MSQLENNEEDSWDVDPAEAEKRKSKSLDLQVTYWDSKGNAATFIKGKGPEELDVIEGAILSIEDPQKMWAPYPGSENGKRQLKILRNEGVTMPAKTLVCERRSTLGNPRINEDIYNDNSEAGKKLKGWLKANGAGKDCANCRFSKPEEYDGDTVLSFCGALRRIYVLCFENGVPSDIKVVEVKSEKSIKAVDAFQASLPSHRPLMSYMSSISVKSFKSKSGTVFYHVKLQTLDNIEPSLKETLVKARDKVLGVRLTTAGDGAEGGGEAGAPRAQMGGKQSAEDDLSVDQIPF